MNSYMQTAFHFLEKRFHASQPGAAVTASDDVVSGYSCASPGFPRESATDDGKRGQAEAYYCHVIGHGCAEGGIDEALPPEWLDAMGVINRCIAATQGTVVHVTGDAVLAKFESLDSALCCAISVRLAVRRFSTGVGSERLLQFHVGVHGSDDATVDGVHRQAGTGRLARSDRPLHCGGICFSGSIHARLKKQSSFKYFSLGKRFVKNINAPVEVFWLAFSKEQIIHPHQAGAEANPQVVYE